MIAAINLMNAQTKTNNGSHISFSLSKKKKKKWPTTFPKFQQRAPG